MDLTIKNFFTATLQAVEDKESKGKSPWQGGQGWEQEEWWQEKQTNCSVPIPGKAGLVSIPRVCQISLWLASYLISLCYLYKYLLIFMGVGCDRR